MKQIPINVRGGGMRGYTSVDDEDFEELSQYRWSRGPKGYIQRWGRTPDGRGTTVRMHRQIMDASDGFVVDHIDHDLRNNTRGNLRVCTPAQNAWNRKPWKRGTSRFLGVCWLRDRKKWLAQIHLGGKNVSLGLFDDEDEAARAYDVAAIRRHDEFARPNFAVS